MSLGTAGCVNDACRIIRDALRSAAAIGPGRVYARVLGQRAAPKLESFACGWLCMECRYLAEPPRRGDPMRSDAATEKMGPCPSCGETAWADLRNREIGQMVDEIDSVDRSQRRERRRRTMFRLSAATLVGAFLGLFVAPTIGWARAFYVLLVAVVALAPFAAIVLVSVSAGWSVRSTRRTNPVRWRMACPKSPRTRGRCTRGALHTEAPMRAPLTGRPCAAYEIGIRDDGRGTARPSTWALLEQHAAHLVVGDTPVERNRPYLRLRRERLEPSQLRIDPAALVVFLRSRGLDPNKSYVFFETILPVGSPCRLWTGRRGQPPVLARA